MNDTPTSMMLRMMMTGLQLEGRLDSTCWTAATLDSMRGPPPCLYGGVQGRGVSRVTRVNGQQVPFQRWGIQGSTVLQQHPSISSSNHGTKHTKEVDRSNTACTAGSPPSLFPSITPICSDAGRVLRGGAMPSSSSFIPRLVAGPLQGTRARAPTTKNAERSRSLCPANELRLGQCPASGDWVLCLLVMESPWSEC